MTLEKYAKIINDKKRSIFFTNDQLLNQTEFTFKALQQFLDLERPLSERYPISPVTGKPGKSDSSKYIKAGCIVRDRKSPDIQIPSEFLEKGQKAFEQCCTTLAQYCTVID